jgi:hypothetical protein
VANLSVKEESDQPLLRLRIYFTEKLPGLSKLYLAIFVYTFQGLCAIFFYSSTLKTNSYEKNNYAHNQSFLCHVNHEKYGLFPDQCGIQNKDPGTHQRNGEMHGRWQH